MNPKLQNIILIIIMAMLIAGGVIIFLQQRSISALNRKVFSQAGGGGLTENMVVADDPEAKLAATLAEQIRNDLIKNTKSVAGTVQGTEGNSLILEAEVVDLPIISHAESSNYKDIPKTKKIFRVAVNDKTEYKDKKVAEIKAGDFIAVVSGDLVYKTDQLTALTIISNPSK